MVDIKRILVPTDFSDPSAKALAYGRALAQLFRSRLEVLHVIDARPFAGTPPPEGYVAEMPEFVPQLESAARSSLARLVEKAPGPGVPLTQAIRWGRPHLEIARYAREHAIDLIVVGTHGRGLMTHLLLGSVAERLVRNAPCPVLTVREREHDFVRLDTGLPGAALGPAAIENEGDRGGSPRC